MRVFVYGTLMTGGYNNYLLEDGKKIGNYRTPPKYALYDLGMFPAMLEINEGVSVRGEVWQVDNKVIDTLDYLEGVPTMYVRTLIRCGKFGTCHTYVMRKNVMDNMFHGSLNKPVLLSKGVWVNE